MGTTAQAARGKAPLQQPTSGALSPVEMPQVTSQPNRLQRRGSAGAVDEVGGWQEDGGLRKGSRARGHP